MELLCLFCLNPLLWIVKSNFDNRMPTEEEIFKDVGCKNSAVWCGDTQQIFLIWISFTFFLSFNVSGSWMWWNTGGDPICDRSYTYISTCVYPIESKRLLLLQVICNSDDSSFQLRTASKLATHTYLYQSFSFVFVWEGVRNSLWIVC